MHGALLIDKPSGPTSHDVVAFARRTLKTSAIGHTGTLDPLATGLLVLLVGHATRLSVLRNIKKVKINNWILGGQFRWSTKSNDPLNAKFYIFQIQSNGTYKLVG